MPCRGLFQRFCGKRSLSPIGPEPSKKRPTTMLEDEQDNDAIFQKTQSQLSMNSGTGRKPPFTIQKLSSPKKSPLDLKKYSVFQLENGILATIVSEDEGYSDSQSNRAKQGPSTSRLTPSEVSTHDLTTDREEVERTSSEVDLEGLERNTGLPTAYERLAACAVTVHAGSFNDPDEIPGLCHLLEHLLSMGSKKYPDENEFEEYLSQRGGYYDALTECEYTTYYFECPKKYLFQAMEMFSQSLMAPLLQWSTITRERNELEMEFIKSANSDDARRMQLICDMADGRNPAKKFTWGNLTTLKDNIGNEKLLNGLKAFKTNNYTADKIRIAIQAKLPTDAMKNQLVRCFSNFPSAKQDDASLPINTPTELFDMKQFCKLYRFQTLSEKCELDINWVLPPMQTKYKTKPLEYISYVIGREGEGSLISDLRKQRLALYLTAEVEEGSLCSNSLYSLFTISISITDKGQENMNKIIAHIFGYLKALRDLGPSERIFNELKDIANTHFKFNQDNAITNVINLSQNMILFPPEHYLNGWKLFFEFSASDIQEYLTQMTPSRTNIMLLQKNHGKHLDKEEFWYKTKYKVEPIPIEWLKSWEKATPSVTYSLPEPNPYITTDFKLINHCKYSNFPEKLVQNEMLEVWHKGYEVWHTFNLPYASINILITIPGVGQSAENSSCQMLFNKMLMYQLIEKLYFAHVAQIEYTCLTVESGVEISIYGFSQKLIEVLRAVACELGNHEELVKAQLDFLETLKKVQRNNLANIICDGEKLLKDLRKSTICTSTYTSGEKYMKLKNITSQNILSYVNGLLKGAYVQALVQGNISAEDALNMMQEFVELLHVETTGETISDQHLVKNIPKGETILKIASFDPEDGNSYSLFYYQYGPTNLKEHAALQLLVELMNQPLIEELKIREQLGYTVMASVTEILDVLGITILINSQMRRSSPKHVNTRVNDFVFNFISYLRMLPEKQFIATKEAFIALKKMKVHGLKNESMRNWWEIKTQKYDFDRREKEIQVLEIIDKKTVFDLADILMNYKKNNQKKLVVQIVGFKGGFLHSNLKINTLNHVQLPSQITANEVIYRYIETTGSSSHANVVNDIVLWKNSLPNYPK